MKSTLFMGKFTVTAHSYYKFVIYKAVKIYNLIKNQSLETALAFRLEK